jgi:hypothetical protein
LPNSAAGTSKYGLRLTTACRLPLPVRAGNLSPLLPAVSADSSTPEDAPMLPVELAARWRGHTGRDMLAWLAAMVCKWYENALLGVEVNSLHIKGEPDRSYTIPDEIAEHYDNLYS